MDEVYVLEATDQLDVLKVSIEYQERRNPRQQRKPAAAAACNADDMGSS